MKIYTRGGDGGTTQLLTVGRVSKAHLRVMAYGEVDELNSLIGWVLSQQPNTRLIEWLDVIQNKLFDLGSRIAVPNPETINLEMPTLEPADIDQLEQWVDALTESLPRLTNFILPGGTPAAAALQVARTVCRRAERALVALSAEEAVEPALLRYLNRLSDLLFTMARYDNHSAGQTETAWRPRPKRH